MRKLARCADCGDEALGMPCAVCGQHVCDPCRLFGHTCPALPGRDAWARHVADGGD